MITIFPMLGKVWLHRSLCTKAIKTVYVFFLYLYLLTNTVVMVTSDLIAIKNCSFAIFLQKKSFVKWKETVILQQL